MLRLLAPRGADCNLRKFAVMLWSQRCATSRNAHSRNRSGSRRIGSAVTTRCGGIDATLLALPLCRWERDQLTRCRRSRCCGAARQLAGITLERGSGQPRQNQERPSGRRRSRTGGRLRVSPLTRSRATLKLHRFRLEAAANFVPPQDFHPRAPVATTTPRALRHINPPPGRRADAPGQ